MCIFIVHINPNNNNRSRLVSSAVFKPLFEPPFGSYISYVATNSEMKKIEFGQDYASTEKNRQIHNHGIARKLMNLVQYISWIKVRNISIYLVASRTSNAY